MITSPSLSLRTTWVTYLRKIVEPPLQALATERFRTVFPAKCLPQFEDERRQCMHLEAIARSLAGLAPWLELEHVPEAEARLQQHLRELARAALRRGLAPASPDALNFTEGSQPLVDAAFLAEALLRAPRQLFHALDEETRSRLLDALRATRRITPYFNNWILFSAMIEAALIRFTSEGDLTRIDYALRQHEQWYRGDGTYGDGPEFHHDYYNSYVIQPMLLEIAGIAASSSDHWSQVLPRLEARARRYAAVLERFISPDGTFPPIGRSLTYRCGAFHHLAFMSLRRSLPVELSPAAARTALNAVILRTLDAPGTFDAEGWLNPGLAGHQPALAEGYISAGSLYLCTTAFLPLGLESSDPFWNSEASHSTSTRIWTGENLSPDTARKE